MKPYLDQVNVPEPKSLGKVCNIGLCYQKVIHYIIRKYIALLSHLNLLGTKKS